MADMVAIAYPVQPDKAADFEANMQKLSQAVKDGLGRRLHQGHHEEFGIQSVKVFHQKKPQDMLIIVVEGEDLERAARERWGRDEVQELNKLIHETTGVHPSVHGETHPNLVHEWTT